ncbi:MAG: Zn-dependent hydrolase [Rhizobiales bacterium]|nr:Zn-dependent hydrolase [Hyphomicrobiales bacterium]
MSLREKLLPDYDRGLDLEGFSGDRLADRLSAIAEIGLTTEAGSCRPGYSQAERQAKDLVCDWMREAGLAVRRDAAGNCFGRLAGRNDHLSVILCGSHIDTVPNGGHFDGVLGVLLALETVEMWKATGFEPERPYEIVIFSEEEGSSFNVGCVGSSAVAGAPLTGQLGRVSDHEGRSFASAVEEVGLSLADFPAARRDLSQIAAFVEVHIEQGLVLERHGLPVGIVNGICGLAALDVTVTGQAGHAGTTPMNYRRDALVAASRIVTAISELPGQISETAVATVGQLKVSPNGSNVVPGKVRFSVDIRDVANEPLERLVTRIVEAAAGIAAASGLGLSWSRTFSQPAIAVDPRLKTLQAEAMRALNLAAFEMPSGAGHDAMILGAHVPMAMFFVRSKDGISHNPLEFSSLNDCAIAARALSRFLARLVSNTD